MAAVGSWLSGKAERRVFLNSTIVGRLLLEKAQLEKMVLAISAEAKLPAATQILSDTLLAPAAAQLGNKRLVIVADGALQYIPFAMLPNPAVGGRLLVSGENQPTAKNLQPLIVGHEVVSPPPEVRPRGVSTPGEGRINRPRGA